MLTFERFGHNLGPYSAVRNRNRNLQTSITTHRRQAQGTSLFTICSECAFAFRHGYICSNLRLILYTKSVGYSRTFHKTEGVVKGTFCYIALMLMATCFTQLGRLSCGKSAVCTHVTNARLNTVNSLPYAVIHAEWHRFHHFRQIIAKALRSLRRL